MIFENAHYLDFSPTFEGFLVPHDLGRTANHNCHQIAHKIAHKTACVNNPLWGLGRRVRLLTQQLNRRDGERRIHQGGSSVRPQLGQDVDGGWVQKLSPNHVQWGYPQLFLLQILIPNYVNKLIHLKISLKKTCSQ
jgi:hypothetical protein